ncbi:MAG: aldehyde dehydrogenase family protein [Candidatus Leucobacter sulfamidivorax]|nr:aldehyde dehydrogenase family protein [Candidatus Leucobacter sulfamidivorax]
MEFPELNSWIGGASEPSAEALPAAQDLHDPNTGERFAENRSASAEQLDRAIAAATAAHEDGRWSGLGAEGRAEVLGRFAAELDGIAERVARLDALNSGVPISVTRLFAGSAGDTVRGAAARAVGLGDERALEAGRRDVRVRRVPWGPTALVAPWNAPSAMAVKKLAFALAAGAPALLKPSSASPWSAELVVEAAVRAGIPEGVVSLVLGSGRIGAQLVADPRVRAISMTGSTPTGRSIAAAAAPHFTRLRLELGSNNPAIVLGDADLTAGAESIASGALKLSGQWCEAPRRVLVQRERLGALVDELERACSAFRIGSSLDDSTALGPVAFEARRIELRAQRDALVSRGARAVEVGEVPGAGWFVPPTLLVGDDLNAEEECFGPMLVVEPFDSVEEAVSRANRGQVGLAGYVFTADEQLGRAIGARLVAGEVKINGTSALDMAPDSVQSFFGDAGIGGHGDAELLEFFTGQQILGTDPPGLPM